MRFAHPELLWLLLLLLPLGLLLFARQRAAERALLAAVGPRMTARLTMHLARGRRSWRRLLLLLAVGCLILALARPQRGLQYATAARTGIDLVVALDVSQSMLAEDLRPSRLGRARHEIAALLDRLQGDRVGLVAFAGAAFVQCPLTLDYSAARMFLDYMTPELIPEPGTSLAEAIRVAVRAFGRESQGFRAMILITDGEDHQGGLDTALEAAREAGVRIFTVGIGSETGEPIPLRNAAGEIEGHKKDRSGQVVLTRLDGKILAEIADRSGGLFVRAGGSLGLERILGEIQGMQGRELAAGIRIAYEERYFYFVWLALACLLIEWRLPLRRGWTRRRPRELTAIALLLALSAGVWAATRPAQGQAPGQGPQQGPPRQGVPQLAVPPSAGGPAAPTVDREAWQGQVEENEVFRARHPDDARPLYNLGTLYHQGGEFAEARAFFEAAVAQAPGSLAGRVAYNLGNTLYRQGEIERARAAFVEALRCDPNNADAKRNLELTQRLLDQLAQMQPPDSTARSQDSSSPEEGDRPPEERQPDRQPPPETESEREAGARQGAEQPRQTGQEPEPPPEQDRPQDQRSQQEPDDREDQTGQAPGQDQPPEEDRSTPPDSAARRDSSGTSRQSSSPAEADSTALSDLQLQQLLRGLESAERDLLKQRFRARSRNLQVEKDW